MIGLRGSQREPRGEERNRGKGTETLQRGTEMRVSVRAKPGRTETGPGFSAGGGAQPTSFCFCFFEVPQGIF